LRMDLVVEFGGGPLIGREAYAGGLKLKKVTVVPVEATPKNLK